MPQPLDQFVKQLTLSTLLSEDEVAAFLAGLSRQPPDGDTLARDLVRQKKLTAYQAQQIYAGKAKSLVLGNYVILEKLGQGGMGMVLKAEHRRMERMVALKVLSPAIVKTPDALRRFQREVKAAARLTHPNIVIAHDADEAGGTHFLVMEFVEGADLSSLVKKSGPLPPEKALACLIQAARGLEYAHAQGIVHRDIKPANLLLDSKGTIKILDMGLARLDSAAAARQDDLTGTGQIMGTVDYMAPEQAASTKSADHRADIYSLGVTLWYLLTGQPLYDGETVIEKLLAHQSKPVPPLPLPLGEGWGEGAARLNAVFQKMVAKAPTDRYPSMTEVIAALEACRAESATPTVSLSQAWAGAAHAEPASHARAGRPDTAQQELRPLKVAKLAASPVLDETLNVAPPSVDTDPTTNLHVGQPLVSAPIASDPSAKAARKHQPLILYGSIGAGILAIVVMMAILGAFTADRTTSQIPPDPSSNNNLAGSDTGVSAPEPPSSTPVGDMPSTAKLAQLAISGVWLNDGGAIVSPVLPYAQLALPGKPQANSANKLTLEVTREAGTGPLVLGLPIGSGRCVATIDNTAAHEVTVGDLPVPAPNKHFPGLVRGQSARIEILFSPNGISINIDGTMILDHQGSLSGATTPARWQTTDPNVLFLGASLSRFRITRLEAGTP